MNKKIFTGIAYVSFIIMVWGTLGSLVDFQFLQSKIYQEGSIGQFSTFSLTGLVFTVAGVRLYPMLLNKLSSEGN
tara:strand:- start:17 stop:241 length:225 start_codon:yes stop_codon:yes gene_type:complete